MPHNATVYGRHAPDLLATLPSLAPGAQVSQEPGRIAVVWPELRVLIATMPRAQLKAHLQGFLGYVSQACELRDPDLPSRIGAVETALQTSCGLFVSSSREA